MHDASGSVPVHPPKRPQRIEARSLGLGAIGGLVFGIGMILAFPPQGYWPATLLMPLAIAWLAGTRAPSCFSLGLGSFLGVLPAWGYEHFWIFNVSELGFPFIIVYSSFFAAITTWLLARVHRRFRWLPLGLACGAVWTLVEVARGDAILGGYPWLLAAHPLIDVPTLNRPGGVVGAYGISFLIACAAGSIIELLMLKRVRAGAATLASVGLIWFALSLLPVPQPVGHFRVAIIQTNVAQDNRTPTTPWETIEAMRSLVLHTREAALDQPAFIVWPESMMPGRTLDPASLAVEKAEGVYYKVRPPTGMGEPFEVNAWEFAEATLELQRDIRIPLIAGSESYTNLRIEPIPEGGIEYIADETFNSAFLIDNGVVQSRYDKIFLTPFGEVMPGIRHWPWLQNRVRALGAYGMPFDLSPGRSKNAFEIRWTGEMPLRAVAPICFEATMPNVCRRLVYGGGTRKADVIVNGTNDGWFNSFPLGRLQHLQSARWRSLELATPMARAANTGVSALVDHRGRLLASGINGQPGAIGADGVLSGELPIIREGSLYAAGGWITGWVLAALGLILSVWSCLPVRADPDTRAMNQNSKETNTQ